MLGLGYHCAEHFPPDGRCYFHTLLAIMVSHCGEQIRPRPCSRWLVPHVNNVGEWFTGVQRLWVVGWVRFSYCSYASETFGVTVTLRRYFDQSQANKQKKKCNGTVGRV